MQRKITLTRQQARELVNTYGSPLYVYDERILRERCREIKGLIRHPGFRPDYSVKANTNREILRIVREEGLTMDAMSPGEILIGMAAGFLPEEIVFIPNNVSAEELQFAIDRGIMISVDSLDQLELYGQLNPGGRIAVRINPGVGAGHHEKVVTGGKCKFGIETAALPQVQAIVKKYNLALVGISQHIGSNFLTYDEYVASYHTMIETARRLDPLEYIDFGGGLGVPYQGEDSLDIESLSDILTGIIEDFVASYANPDVKIRIEPGRYVVAECGQLLGTVQAVKVNYEETYVGTDIGFNVLMRPVMYDSYHEIVAYTEEPAKERVHVVGNICESGDVVGRARLLPKLKRGDIIGVENAGAYGYSMSSNYNSRLRPAEVLLAESGEAKLIRRRDTYEDLLRGF